MKHIGTQILTTERLTLRRFEIEDAANVYYNWASDAQVTKYMTWPPHKSEEETQEKIREWVSAYEREDVYRWAIELNETEQPIGAICAAEIDDGAQCVEISWCLGKKYWNQGYTSEALAEVMRFFFEEVGASRVWSAHNVANVNAGKVMEKCGMIYEGTLRRHRRDHSGIADIAVYGALRENAEDDPEKEQEEMSATVEKVVAEDGTTRNVISDETMEYVGILAKLELSPAEAEAAKKDMGEMLDYIDQLNELDTSGVEPMSHIFPVQNVFREDVVENGDGSEDTLANAPLAKDGGFKVPKTIGE